MNELQANNSYTGFFFTVNYKHILDKNLLFFH